MGKGYASVDSMAFEYVLFTVIINSHFVCWDSNPFYRYILQPDFCQCLPFKENLDLQYRLKRDRVMVFQVKVTKKRVLEITTTVTQVTQLTNR